MAASKRAGSLNSMTGFASLSGDSEVAKWDWELRSVNGKGLDLRMRLPDGSETLERQLRAVAAKVVTRGNITISLRLTERRPPNAVELDPQGLAAALDSLSQIDAQAKDRGMSLTPMTAADIATVPGVIVTGSRDKTELPVEIANQIPELFDLFAHMRSSEGAALGAVMTDQLSAMASLIDRAAKTAEARAARQGELLREKVEALLDTTEISDPARLHQEMAILAVKADVTEEIDRLRAHVSAAADLLRSGVPVGRKLDFLMQEFNREANTLCSKSGSTDLTTIGLDLKVLIDQMREQVQNLE